MKRIQRDETKFTALDFLAWEWSLPWYELEIMNYNEFEVDKMKNFLTKVFTPQEIEEAGKRVKEVRKQGKMVWYG